MLVNEERIIGRFEQQPWERKRYRVDYRQHLADGEAVLVPTVVAFPDTDPLLVIDEIAVETEGKELILFVSGGLDGTLYRLRLRATTSDGQALEDEIEFRVREF